MPCAPFVLPVTLRLGPSTSVSLPSTLTFPAVSSAVVSASVTACGASLTAVTVMLTVTTFDWSDPSEAL